MHCVIVQARAREGGRCRHNIWPDFAT